MTPQHRTQPPGHQVHGEARRLLASPVRFSSRQYGATATPRPLTPRKCDASVGEAEPTPLDMGQIWLLSLTRVSEPLTFCVLLPFVNQMVMETGQVDIEDVGYAVGLVETAFSLTQVVFLLSWCRAADAWGRKPVLLFSLFGAVLASIAFGFASRMWQMYAARCVAGIFGGNAVVIRTLFAENSNRSNQAKAFSYFAFAANIGSLIGPVMGGFLAQPATQWPSVFGHIDLLVKYPYALPCLAAGAYVLVTLVLCIIYLREPPRAKIDRPLPLLECLSTPMPLMLSIYGVTVCTVFCLSALLPLHLFTPVPLGGGSEAPAGIARIMAATGFAQSIWLLVAMPRLDARFGTRRLFIYTAASYPFVMALPVVANMCSRAGAQWLSTIVLGVYVVVGSGINMSFTSVQLLINSTTPPAALSIVNGAAQMIAATVKSIGPASINALFAFGVKHQVLAGYLAWAAMAALGTAVFLSALAVPADHVYEKKESTDGDTV